MRILHLLDHSIPLHSGYTFRTRAILTQQRVNGWETFHITSAKHRDSDAAYEDIDGFRFYRTPSSDHWCAKLPVLNQVGIVTSLVRRVDEIIGEIKPDVIHAHSPALNGLAALMIKKRYKLPMVYECRAFWEDAAVDHGTSQEGGLRYRVTKMLETYVFARADAIVVICEGLRQDIAKRGIPLEKITVVPNAVDIEKFSINPCPDEALRERLGLKGRRVLGFIGSFYAYEGLPLLLEALPRILEQQADACVLLVGGGPQEALLRQRALELGIESKVIFTGRVPHDQVQNYYDLVDIFVYPRISIRLTELVTPLKPLEAMAQGRLLVASDIGGHNELIRDRETGLLFQPGNVAALAEAVMSLLQDDSCWPRMRQAGRRYVEQERCWSKSVERYAPVYQALLS